MHAHPDPNARRLPAEAHAARTGGRLVPWLVLFALACSSEFADSGARGEGLPGTGNPPAAVAGECATPQAAWIWCDDFEADRLASYFEVDQADGRFARTAGVGQNGSYGMRATFQPWESSAGNLKLAFGASPDPGTVRPVDAGVNRYRDIYWRMFVRTQAGWTGAGADKLSRAMVLATKGWGQAAVGHVWTPESGVPTLSLDPVRGTDANGTLTTSVYNDFANYTWLGAVPATTLLFDQTNADRWFCVEAHMKLNDAGLSDGVFELWIDQKLEASENDLNWLGSYRDYGINAIFFENFWGATSPVTQSRYFDNIVVSTQPIGC